MNNSKSVKNTVNSITAHIDLLGFSNHLVLSSYDLRTKIGEEAIKRLEILEEATNLIKLEFEKVSEFYPKDFRYMRFNDSLILGIDIDLPFTPKIGKSNEKETFTFTEIKNFFGNEKSSEDVIKDLQGIYDIEAFKVSQFIGIVSRVHNFINQKEFAIHMPGCRTIISSGLRYKFIKKNRKEDYYSANFSLSNAYLVNDLGTKHGFSGNKCYLENNVANYCSMNIYTKRILGYTKFIDNDIQTDPYNGKSEQILMYKNTYSESKIIETNLFNKKYQFREIDTYMASILQLFPEILSLIESDSKKSKLKEAILNSIQNDTPNLEELNKKHAIEFPILFLNISLEENIKKISQEILQDVKPASKKKK